MKNVAVIGYGGMGRWHVSAIVGKPYYAGITFDKSDVVELAGIYDIDEKKREAIKADGYHCYETFEEVLADPSVDIVVLAVPNNFHEPLAIQALDAGKNVLSEKPVTLSSESLERMIAAAEKNGKIFSVHQNRRFDSYFVTMKKLAEEGAVGDIISLESRIQSDHGVPGDWRKTVEAGGGMLYDWGVHMLDQQLFLLGYDVDRVYAHFDYLTGIPVDDGCYVDVFFKSGKFAHMEVCTYNFLTLPIMYMRGTTGSALFNFWEQPIKVRRCTDWDDTDDILPVKADAGLSKTIAKRNGRSVEEFDEQLLVPDVHDYYRNFCAAIDGTETQLVTHDQMRMVMKVIDAAFESARTNKVINL